MVCVCTAAEVLRLVPRDCADHLRRPARQHGHLDRGGRGQMRLVRPHSRDDVHAQRLFPAALARCAPAPFQLSLFQPSEASAKIPVLLALLLIPAVTVFQRYVFRLPWCQTRSVSALNSPLFVLIFSRALPHHHQGQCRTLTLLMSVCPPPR
eukprot:3719732-Pleurochrysis_carterae.AAC.2